MSFRIGKNDNILILGQRGTGKSTLLRYLIENTKRRVVIFDPHYELVFPGRKTYYDYYTFLKVLDVAWKYGHVTLAIDEAHIVLRRTPFPLKGTIAKVVNMGRHRDIGIWSATPRITQLHGDYISSCSHIFMFRLTSRPDCEYLSHYLGDVAFYLPNLRNYYYIHWHNGDFRLCKPIRLKE